MAQPLIIAVEPSVALEPAPARSGKRLASLDLFRGWWVLVMMDAHVTNALVRPATGRFYEYHQMLFNLAAPGFLFASGMSFGMSAGRRWKDYRSWSASLRNRLKRIGQILLLGYMLHLPFFSLHRLLSETSPAQISAWLSMDVLQCVAASALILLVLLWTAPRLDWFARSCIALAAVVALVTTPVWATAPKLPWWLGTLLSKNWGSFFPLLPYSAFAFAGAAYGQYDAAARSASVEKVFVRRAGWLAAALVCGSLLLLLIPWPGTFGDMWNADPIYFGLRIGLLLVSLVAFSIPEIMSAPGMYVLELIGRESLMVYLAHLVIVYGWVINPETNLKTMFPNGLSNSASFIVLALLAAAMILLAYGWFRWKKAYGAATARWGWAVAAALLAFFLWN